MKKIYHKVKRIKQTGLNCGPTSLAQLVYYYGCSESLEEIIRKTKMIKGLGTFDGFLGKTAIALRYKVNIIPQNLYVFDPTWYTLPKKKLLKKLKLLKKHAKNRQLKTCVTGYIKYLEAGGRLEFKPLSKKLLIERLEKHPILVGLCSTYLYKQKRTNTKKIEESDITGWRTGHFLIVNGYDPKTDKFYITDPWYKIPFSKSGKYKIRSDVLLTAMFLGEATYDCIVLEIV